jgi:hypothetical protein
MQSMRKLLNHRLFLSVALTETGGVHSLRLRSIWLVAACVFALSGWLGMVVAGDLAGARLKAKLTGNAELQYYIDQIAELRNQAADIATRTAEQLLRDAANKTGARLANEAIEDIGKRMHG